MYPSWVVVLFADFVWMRQSIVVSHSTCSPANHPSYSIASLSSTTLLDESPTKLVTSCILVLASEVSFSIVLVSRLMT